MPVATHNQRGLATLARRAPVPRCVVAHRISSDRLFEGETTTVTVTVSADAPSAESVDEAGLTPLEDWAGRADGAGAPGRLERP